MTLTVNSTGDAGDAAPGNLVCDDGAGNCTLRAAIQEANAVPGADTINFSIGTGPVAIPLTSGLPTITDAVTIDGGTQPAFGWVELAGDGLSTGDGLHITAGNSTVQKLSTIGFPGNGIVLEGGGGNMIQHCVLGANNPGPPVRANGGYGVRITESPNNTIEDCTISGNASGGILIEGAAATGNTVQPNAIGVLLDGVTAIGNGGHGVSIVGAANNTIADSVISANSGSGVHISGGGASGNLLRGNIIGADGTGTLDRGNAQDGVFIDGAPDNSVGVPSPAPETGNLISGNDRAGVHISGAGAEDNQVQHNGIGVQLDLASPLGNGSHGVWIEGNNNLVGGPASEPPATIPPSTWVVPDTLNTIANNGGAGVFVDGSGNSIRANNIYDNASLGIDVYPPGPSLPWTESAQSSALWSPQWFWVVDHWEYGPMVVGTGYTHGAWPDTPVVVEGFVSPTCDASDYYYGEGKEWRAGGDPPSFHIDADGNMSTTGGFPSANVVGQYLTTTVTNSLNGTTTEFGHCAQIKPDTDGDNIANEVDTVLGDPGVRSHDFSDVPLGGTTFGSLIEDGPNGRNGCFVSVADMPSPDGVVIGATCLPKEGGGWQGPAHVRMCAGTLLDTIVDLPHATSLIWTGCSSQVDVGYGPVFVGLGTMSARLPTADEVQFNDPVDGNYDIVNDSTSPTIWVGGVLIGPGETVTVHDADSDGMADAYETAHDCLNPNVNDAKADPDHDGVNNLSEAEAGTDPCPAAAVGGIAELPDIGAASPEEAGTPAGGSGWSAGGYAALAGGLAAAVAALAVGGWCARRRWGR
jgi:CSLREA domain-containing protein